MSDLKNSAKARYKELQKQLMEIHNELTPLRKYLENTGVLKKSGKGRKKLKETAESN